MLAGTPISRSTLWMASMASLSDLPGARLNEIVTAGNCPWWLIESDVVAVETDAKVESGTSVLWKGVRICAPGVGGVLGPLAAASPGVFCSAVPWLVAPACAFWEARFD